MLDVPPMTEFEDITPDATLAGWTELPYTFTYRAAWFDELSRRGVDVAALRCTPVPNSTQWYRREDGALVCRGDEAHAWLRFDRLLRDFRVHLEWKFHKLDRPALYNSGVFVRNDAVLNVFTQVETGFDRRTAGFFFTKKFVEGNKATVYGLKPDESGRYVPFDPQQPGNPDLINPPGEWNSYDIQVVGREARLWTNSVHNNLFTCELDEGYFGLEAEMHEIAFRNIRLQVLNKPKG